MAEDLKDIEIGIKTDGAVAHVDALTESLNKTSGAMGNTASAISPLEQKWVSAAGNMTEEEKKLIAEIERARVEMASKILVADALGVSVNDVSKGMKALSGETRESAKEFSEHKKEMREGAHIIEEVTGLHLGLGQALRTATNPAMIAAAGAALLVGEGIKKYKEEEKEHEEVMKTYHTSIIHEADILLKLRDAHVALNQEERETIALANQFRSLEWGKEYQKISDDVETMGTRVEIANKSIFTQLFGLDSIKHPLERAIVFYYELTGQQEKLAAAYDDATAAQKRQIAENPAHIAALQAREKFEGEALRVHLASLGKEARAQEEHEIKMNQIRTLAAKAHQDPAKLLADENARYKMEEDALTGSEARKGKTADRARAARIKKDHAASLKAVKEEFDFTTDKDKKNEAAHWASIDRLHRDELAADKKFHAISEKEELKHTKAIVKIDKAMEAQRKAMIQSTLAAASQGISAMFGNNKAAAKTAAGIDLLRGIMADVGLGYPMMIPAIIATSIIGKQTMDSIDSAQAPAMAGQADGGMIAPADGSYLMNLRQGEHLIPDHMLGDVAQSLRDHAPDGGGGGHTYITNYHGTVFAQADADRQIAQAGKRGRRAHGIGV